MLCYSPSLAIAAVTIIYAANIVTDTQYAARLFAEVHSLMTSAERTLAYTKIKAEKGRDVNEKPPQNWRMLVPYSLKMFLFGIMKNVPKC